MSYNISTWKTKQLNNLVIPISAFFKHERTDWHPKLKFDEDTGERILDFNLEDGDMLVGKIEDGFFKVENINIYAEKSGTFYEWVLEPALEESTGELEAVLIWEGGDSITQLKVNNGNVEVAQVEL